MSYLKSIKRFTASDNLGGILYISVARKDDIESIPDPIFRIIPADIVFKAGCGFVTWEVTHESINVNSKSRSTREGSSKTNRLSFLIPKERYALAPMFDQAEEDEFIVFYKDGNSTGKLFGLTDSPVKFSYDHDSGSKIEEGNFYNAEFFFDGPDNRYFYSGTIEEAPIGTGSSILRYSTGEVIATLNPTDVLTVSSDFAHTFTLVPGPGTSALPAVVKWDDGTVIASLQPGDVLIVETDFTFDFELIGNI